MNNLDKNWNNLFGEYTADETAWHGQWTVYSPNQEVIKSQQRTSAAIIYGENGQLNRIVQIREHLGCFSDESPSLETSEISGNWIGKKRSMTSDLSVSPEERESYHKITLG